MRKTRFTQRIRIDPAQLDWIKANMAGRKTAAGRLDEIINHFKDAEHKAVCQALESVSDTGRTKVIQVAAKVENTI